MIKSNKSTKKNTKRRIRKNTKRHIRKNTKKKIKRNLLKARGTDIEMLNSLNPSSKDGKSTLFDGKKINVKSKHFIPPDFINVDNKIQGYDGITQINKQREVGMIEKGENSFDLIPLPREPTEEERRRYRQYIEKYKNNKTHTHHE